MYSDADGRKGIDAVAQSPDAQVLYLRGRIPSRIIAFLDVRRTNIIANELLAALACICLLCPAQLRGMHVVHFIDNKAALACVLRGFSTKHDLAEIAGRLWFEALALGFSYEVHYVERKCNLADGPSRA